MSKTKTTKRALLSSVLAMLLCVTMLIGTTFAWFTDTASTAVNKIQAGNLDIELEYSTNGADWATVQDADNLIDPDALWEPGHTEVVYLRLSNKGTLALKYRFSMAVSSETPGTNLAGNPFKLSDYIQFSFIEGDAVYATRDEARTAAGVGTVLSSSNTEGRAHDEVGTMNAGANARYFALVVFMPETVGNDANYKAGTIPPRIELGLNLIATQLASESDSFDNQYDGGANLNGDYMASSSAVVTAPAAGQPMEIVLNNNSPVSVENSTVMTMSSVSDALAGKEVEFKSSAMNSESAQANFNVATGANVEVAALKLEMKVDGVTTSNLGGTATITTYIQAGLTDVGVVYVGTGAQPTNVQYDPSTGKLSFDTTHFSDYVVTAKGAIKANGNTYGSLAEAIAANQGGTINITGPVVMFADEGSSVVVDMNNVTIDGGNNATLIFRNVDGNGAGGTGSFANMTLKNLSVVDETYYIYENGENAWEFTYLEFSGTNTFNNVNFTDGVMFEGEMSICTDCTFIGHNNDSSNLGNVTMYGAWVTNGSASFNNCTFTGTRGLKISEIYGTDTETVTVDGCTFDNLSQKPGLAIDIQNNGTADIIIKNSEFTNCKPGDQGLYIYETDNVRPSLENNTVIIKVSTQEEFNAAFSAANSETSLTIVLGTGSYKLNTVAALNKTVAISGTKDTVIDLTSATGQNLGGTDITFENVTVKGTNSDYVGIQHSGDIVYNNVTFEGSTTLYGESVTFNNCTFNLSTRYIWTYGAKEVTFKNCTFNTDGKAILIYAESGVASQTVNVNGCTFNATKTGYTGSGAPCAAVEIDASLISGRYTVNFTGTNTVDSDFNGTYRIKNNSESKVTINGIN